MDTSLWIARVVVAAVGGVALIATLALLVFRRGARAMLVAGLLPLALVAPVVATTVAAYGLTQVFQKVGADGGGNVALLLLEMGALWGVVRIGFGLAALIGLAGLIGGLVRPGAASEARPPCSTRRSLVLLALPCVALLLASLPVRQLRLALDISQAVLADNHADPARQAAAKRYLEGQGLGGRGAGSIAKVSDTIAFAILLASLGGAALAVILLAFAAGGTILGWRRSADPIFVAASSLVWLLLITGTGAIAAGILAPRTF